ncbi:MAG: PH domain-containing protein [Nitrospirales bacterium]
MSSDETVIWTAYPSWAQFVWLYLFSALAGLRGLLHLTFDLPGWEGWLAGAGGLVVCAGLLRHWARYTITTRRVLVTNGYTCRDIQAMPLRDIGRLTLQQGPIARWFGIGTLEMSSADEERIVRFRGIKNPEVRQARLEALRP